MAAGALTKTYNMPFSVFNRLSLNYILPWELYETTKKTKSNTLQYEPDDSTSCNAEVCLMWRYMVNPVMFPRQDNMPVL